MNSGFPVSVLLWAVLIFSHPVKAQLLSSILFVEDTQDLFSNAEIIKADLDELTGGTYTLYNTFEEGQSPPLSLLQNHQLVIWYCGSDLEDLYFWDGLDQDNQALAAYLELGGWLWLIGTDVLYDRYGPAPADFSPGEFVYDWLGIERYQLQTYADDGGIGLPYATPDPNAYIYGLDTLTWQFPTLYYVDGVLPREGVLPVYRMDVGGYVFRDSICGVYYPVHGIEGGGVMSFFFDLALVSPADLRQQTLLFVLEFFDSIVKTKDPILAGFGARLFPNPVSGSSCTLQLQMDDPQLVSCRLVDLSGRAVTSQLEFGRQQPGNLNLEIPFPSLPPGFYVLEVTIGSGTGGIPVIVGK
ncbi:MAG: T9SS type A sorting domain-containing protein [Saprospiraceae bacterium]